MSETSVNDNKTSIPLDKDTRNRLRKYGEKGETYVVILTRLMDRYDECKREETECKAVVTLNNEQISEQIERDIKRFRVEEE